MIQLNIARGCALLYIFVFINNFIISGNLIFAWLSASSFTILVWLQLAIFSRIVRCVDSHFGFEKADSWEIGTFSKKIMLLCAPITALLIAFLFNERILPRFAEDFRCALLFGGLEALPYGCIGATMIALLLRSILPKH